jgi:hypothetical protein
MMAFIEELAIGIAVSLGVRSISAAAEVLFAPEKAAKPERGQICSRFDTVAPVNVSRPQDDSTTALAE